jgi:hypothetical protein
MSVEATKPSTSVRWRWPKHEVCCDKMWHVFGTLNWIQTVNIIKPTHSKIWLIQNSDTKFHDILTFISNLHPKEEKFVRIYLAISKFITRKRNLSWCGNFHTVLPK